MSNATPNPGPDELELISRVKAKLPVGDSVVVGAGDDCAVIDAGVPGQWQLHKTDAVVEGIHFKKDADPQQVGHKALGRALSDIAAMAGTPRWATITLGLPDGFAAETCRVDLRRHGRLGQAARRVAGRRRDGGQPGAALHRRVARRRDRARQMHPPQRRKRRRRRMGDRRTGRLDCRTSSRVHASPRRGALAGRAPSAKCDDRSERRLGRRPRPLCSPRPTPGPSCSRAPCRSAARHGCAPASRKPPSRRCSLR